MIIEEMSIKVTGDEKDAEKAFHQLISALKGEFNTIDGRFTLSFAVTYPVDRKSQKEVDTNA